MIREPGFIASLLEYQPDNMDAKTRFLLQRCYLDRNSWSVEAIKQVSVAASTVAFLVESQVKCATLRNQLDQLDTMEPIDKHPMERVSLQNNKANVPSKGTDAHKRLYSE